MRTTPAFVGTVVNNCAAVLRILWIVEYNFMD
jgi:hypothetical protein